jgi:PAS domain S-box-containing protein
VAARPPLHRRLKRQLRAAGGHGPDVRPDWDALLGLVSRAYAGEERRRRRDDAVIASARDELNELGQRFKQEAAARTREKLRIDLLLDNASEAIVSGDGQGNIILFNKAAERVFGWTREEALGRSTSILFADWPSAAQTIQEAFRAFPEGQGRIEIELPGVRKNGEVFPRELSLSMLVFEGQLVRLGFHRDISGRKAQEETLLAAKEAAESANNAKSGFLAAMSHEIRTPLNGVLGMAAALQASGLTEDQQRMLKVINESGQVLMTLLSDILDLSKIEAGGMSFERTPFEAAASAQAVATLYAETAAAKGLDYGLTVAQAAQGWFVGDPTRYRQVLQNLVSNALKFTERGSVSIALDVWVGPDGGERLRTTIEDTGVGVPAEARARLFQKFNQADASTTRRYGGTGLGLSICKELVEAQDGQIGVESAPGAGSRFWFDLPMARAEAIERSAPMPTAVRLRGPASLRILAADDNPTNQMVLQALLAELGAEVAFVANGAEAVQAVASQDFDIVLMDVQMPVMDGMAAARAIRALEGRRARTPIIAVTADAMAEQVAACVAAGMDGHVAKPLRLEELFAVIQQALDQDPPSDSAARSA